MNVSMQSLRHQHAPQTQACQCGAFSSTPTGSRLASQVAARQTLGSSHDSVAHCRRCCRPDVVAAAAFEDAPGAYQLHGLVNTSGPFTSSQTACG